MKINLDEEKINKTYESLSDLTRNAKEENKYFSANRIYWHGEGDSYEQGIWNEKDEDGIPSRKENESFLEVLLDRKKAVRVITEASFDHRHKNLKFYRAILEG